MTIEFNTGYTRIVIWPDIDRVIVFGMFGSPIKCTIKEFYEAIVAAKLTTPPDSAK